MKKPVMSFLSILAIVSLVACTKGNSDSTPDSSGSANSSQADSSSLIDVSSNNSSDDGESSSSSSIDLPAEGTYNTADTVTIHYKNEDSSVTSASKELWIWAPNESGTVHSFTGTDDFGGYFTFDTASLFTSKKNYGPGFYFIVKNINTWDGQTDDQFVSYATYAPTLVGDKYELDLYVIQNAKGALNYFTNADDVNADYISSADLNTTGTQITITGSPDSEIISASLYILTPEFYNRFARNGSFPAIDNYLSKNYDFSTNKAQTETIDITDYQVNYTYYVTASFASKPTKVLKKVVSNENVVIGGLLDSFSYSGNDLGATFTYDESGKITATTFKVFAPTSGACNLCLYDYGNKASDLEDSSALTDTEKKAYDEPSITYRMKLDENGVYSYTVNQDISGSYYTYTFYRGDSAVETIDPYAHACGLNGKRGMVVDFNGSAVAVKDFDDLPLKWDGTTDYDISSPMDLVVSENNIRDLTMDSSWSSNADDLKVQGTYEAFYKKGTTYTSDSKVTVKTGFDHLEEYGVNAVQLLPIFDQDNSEQASLMKYNWGYNPLNYNCLEGGYSTDPYDGHVRIKEFKNLVASYATNANKTRIIMDVVYNHVSAVSTNPLNYTVPYYYFRLNADGSLKNGSGCGNEFRSECKMGSKFIVDSLCFWANTYKIKGFRFDLMGLLDCDTLIAAKTALSKIDPDIVMYGEGWTATGSADSNAATSSNVYSKLYATTDSPISVGCFNDAGRDGLKGSNDPGYGFISQGSSDLTQETVTKVADMLVGNHTGAGSNPVQTVNYASCHDNFTLFDQLNWTLSEDGGTTEPELETVAKASVAANGLVILSNGISFINGGEEIFRTKTLTDDDSIVSTNEKTMYGKRISHNSYNASDECNSYKYDRKADLLTYFNMYKSLIALRKKLVNVSYPDNTDSSKNKIDVWNDNAGNTTLGFYRQGNDGNNYFIYINGRNSAGTIGSSQQTSLVFNNSSSTPGFNNYTYSFSDKYQLVVYTTAA